MSGYFVTEGSKFKGRPLTTLPVVLNRDLSRIINSNLQLKSSHDLEHLRSIAQQRDERTKLTARIREAAEASQDFWTAPELLRSDLEEWPTQACDVYSYAIILQELFTRDDPYFELAEHLTPEQILDAVVHNRLRPEPSSDAPIIVRQVMELAWSDIPAARPTFEQVVSKSLAGLNGKSKRLPVRLSAHVGSVGTGTMGVACPKFVVLGRGVDVGRALLEGSEVNTVKISRSLYSQIEKCPDFEFFSREPEWITCNGTDIEAYVLTGRQACSGQTVSSDTSVDSGVFVDGPGKVTTRGQTAGTSSAIKDAGDLKTRRPARPSLFLGGQPRQVDSERTSSGGPIFTSGVRDGKNRKPYSLAEGKRRLSATDFRSTQLSLGAALPRISEDSDTAVSTCELRQATGENVGLSSAISDKSGIGSTGVRSNENYLHKNRTAQSTNRVTETLPQTIASSSFDGHIALNSGSKGVTLSEPKPQKSLERKLSQQEEKTDTQTETSYKVPKLDLRHKPHKHRRFGSRQYRGSPPLTSSSIKDTQASSSVRDTPKEHSSLLIIPSDHSVSNACVRYSSPSLLKKKLRRPQSPDGISMTSTECASVKSGSSSSSYSHRGMLEIVDRDINLLPSAEGDRDSEMLRLPASSPEYGRGQLGPIQQEVVVNIEHTQVSSLAAKRNSDPFICHSPSQDSKQRSHQDDKEQVNSLGSEVKSQDEPQIRHRNEISEGNKISRKNKVYPL
ncbi:atrial natriuretic peptide receptor 1-like [Elysia marginata]|uniref:Atrial natriuretic peptide receptor 1-like n=1 Tax=Elysia marginata TaxID=1093978 RepID=A0AAV4F9T8_9GAST|nr:atrial natriuretic peptide receptor 1-like [Elysia marginata]